MSDGRFQPVPLRERFMDSFAPEPYSGCWLWDKSYRPAGGGDLRPRAFVNRQSVAATHVSLHLFRGVPLTKGMHVLHKCDCSACVNPDHLYVGTHQQNMRDRDERGRKAHGERHGMSKLTAAQVKSIRGSQEKTIYLANKYGVHTTAIQRIRSGKLWKEVV